MRLRDEIRWEREQGFLFDSRLGGIYALNETSACVLEGLARGLAEGELAAELVARFEIGELAAREDLSAFLGLLLENDLVSY